MLGVSRYVCAYLDKGVSRLQGRYGSFANVQIFDRAFSVLDKDRSHSRHDGWWWEMSDRRLQKLRKFISHI